MAEIVPLPKAQRRRSLDEFEEPLSVNAKRAGWQGFNYDLEAAGPRLIFVTEGRIPKRRPVVSAPEEAIEDFSYPLGDS